MIYIKSMRLSFDDVKELESMGFFVELDSKNGKHEKALYSVFVTA